MPQSDRSHAVRPRGRRLRRVTGSLVVLVLLAAVAAYQFQLGPRWFGFDYPSPVEEPAAVPPPRGLTLPAADDPAPVAEVASAITPVPGGVGRMTIAMLLRNTLQAFEQAG